MTEYLSFREAERASARLEEIETAVGTPASSWAKRCHAASLAVLRTGLLGPGRVARGGCRGVPGQHSWILLGADPYDQKAVVADPTYWSYAGWEPQILVRKNSLRAYVPHGAGSIWAFGQPPEPCGKVIRLAGEEGLSGLARAFLEVCGPLDRRGWMFLANAPVQDWPAAEIIEAICDTPELGPALVPIDVIGMLTDRNPSGLFW